MRMAGLCQFYWRICYPPFASRANGEVFVLLYMFVCSSTSTKCGRTLVPDVSFPLLGVGGPRRAEKGANEIFVTIGVNGEFLHFGGFRAISQQRLHASTPNIICIRIMSADVPPPPVGSIGPWGAGGGGVKTKKWRIDESAHLSYMAIEKSLTLKL